MLFASNYSHPRGLIGRYMLRRRDREHEPLAVWGFDMIGIPQRAKMLDIGCGGGYNIRRMLERSPESRIYGLDISKQSVKLARAVNRKECLLHNKNVNRYFYFTLQILTETGFLQEAQEGNIE